MVLSIFIILFIGIIAYFHFVQGFFSATISAMIAVIAGVMAISYHETLVNLLLKGALADYAHSIALCIIFAVVYFVLRLIFDAAIPGNVRTPATIDKVGGAIMGIVCAIFATGIFAIAVEMLPFDPNMAFMGANRFATRDNLSAIVPNKGRSNIDAKIFEQMDDNALTPDKEKGLLVPVDEWVLNTVYRLSDGGSLSGDRTLASIHPDYVTEIFGQRLGIQTGGSREALQYAGHTSIEVSNVFNVASLIAKEGALKEVRASTYTPLYKDVVKPPADQRILVVRIKVDSGATADDDKIFRFSTGSIHLVGKVGSGYKDYYPIGTLEGTKTVLINTPDDFLFTKEGNGFDAVFVVDSSLLVGKQDAVKVAPETFISIKRFANLDLSNMEVKEKIPADSSIQQIRHPMVYDEDKIPAPTDTPASSAEPMPASVPVPVLFQPMESQAVLADNFSVKGVIAPTAFEFGLIGKTRNVVTGEYVQ